MSQNQVTYSISREMLSGKITNVSFQMGAASGGRRGRAYNRAALSSVSTWDPGMKLPYIEKSVGKSKLKHTADNARRDVRVVQALLNLYGHNLIVDGHAGR